MTLHERVARIKLIENNYPRGTNQLHTYDQSDTEHLKKQMPSSKVTSTDFFMD